MKDVNTRVILVAGDGNWSEGFGTKEDIKRIPEKFHGGIWTIGLMLLLLIMTDCK